MYIKIFFKNIHNRGDSLSKILCVTLGFKLDYV